MTIPLQSTTVYGPVRSRRLGRSLGVNLLSTQRKECNFNCLYCQYGWSPPLSHHDPGPRLRSKEIIDAVKTALLVTAATPAVITFSGNGEPTLYPEFPEIVDAVINLRNRLSPESQVAVLSNGSTAAQPDIQKALARLDLRIMKLDAGSEADFRSFNRPMDKRLSWETIVTGLSRLEDIVIQALFAGGPKGNSAPSQVSAWIEVLKAIQPQEVQIYTLDRPHPSRYIESASENDLIRIQHQLKEAGLDSTVYRRTPRPPEKETHHVYEHHHRRTHA